MGRPIALSMKLTDSLTSAAYIWVPAPTTAFWAYPPREPIERGASWPRNEDPMEKKNREQRRRDKFGHAGGATKDPWPQSEANPVFDHGDAADDAGQATADPPVRTGGTGQGATKKTSPAPGAPKKAPAKSSIAKASTRTPAAKADRP